MQEDPPAGVPEWVVTYGDMMSLLLTFFIMLVSLSEVRAEKKFRAVMESLQQYMGYRSAPASPQGEHFPMNSMLESIQFKLGAFSDQKHKGGIKTRSIEGDDVRVFRNREGKTTHVGSPLIFMPGSTEMSHATAEELTGILEMIAGKPNKIELRSHASSDPLPADSHLADKHVLTYERARSVYDFLVKRGVDPNRIRITAASDLELESTGEKQLRSDDRVDIYLIDAFTEEYVGPRVDR
ncbi:MAG: OmpA family protein [Planctomycetota bacterium]|nr:OmpA family protein [Planctomycetota bacterium]MDA1212704.1 OmpA family protein [Planctomycetota bacterium]